MDRTLLEFHPFGVWLDRRRDSYWESLCERRVVQKRKKKTIMSCLLFCFPSLVKTERKSKKKGREKCEVNCLLLSPGAYVHSIVGAAAALVAKYGDGDEHGNNQEQSTRKNSLGRRSEEVGGVSDWLLFFLMEVFVFSQ